MGCGCGVWGGVWVIDCSSGYKVVLPLKTKFPSLLIRFTMTIDGKYKNNYVDFSR